MQGRKQYAGKGMEQFAKHCPEARPPPQHDDRIPQPNRNQTGPETKNKS